MPADRQSIFDDFLRLLGELNYSWTNTESLLIHLIAGLSKVEKDVAVIIFLTLNTTRARIDLVQRLSKMPGVDKEMRNEVLELTGKLQRYSGLRNRYNHCIYSFDNEDGSAKTILMRIADRKSEIKVGQVGDLDDVAIEEMSNTIVKLKELNRSFWDFFVKNGMG